jgi:thioesterase domain-containing protein
MVPAAMLIVAALPLTPSGKVDRRALPAPDERRSDEGVGFVAPRTPLEREIAGLWEAVLGVRPVGVRDNFFDLGGHSLLAADLFTRIAERFGRSLPLSVLLDEGTVEHLAGIVSEKVALPTWSPLVPIKPRGSLPPFFCVHPDHGDVVAFVTIARHLGEDQPFYAFRARGLDGTEAPWADLPAIAADYVAQMRTVQPSGPYFIGGHSLGVGIAFEMAQQLTAAGETVALVALFDDTLYALETHISLLDLDTVLFYLRKAPVLLRRLWSSPDGPRAALGRILGGLIRHPQMFEARREAGQYHARRFGQIQAAQYRAWMDYRPQVYPGRLILLRSEEQPLSRMRDPLMGWGRVAAGGVEVRPVGGSHDTLTREPYVRELAAQLKLSLATARAAVKARAAEVGASPARRELAPSR